MRVIRRPSVVSPGFVRFFGPECVSPFEKLRMVEAGFPGAIAASDAMRVYFDRYFGIQRACISAHLAKRF